MSRKLGSIVFLSLLLVSIFGFSVFAADTGGAPPTSDDRAQMEEKMKAENENFISKLAANLGVDEDTLNAALQETQEQILAEKVANGEITQEQADKVTEHGINFGLGFDGHGGHGGPGGPGGPPPSGDSNTSSGSQGE